MSAGHLDEAAKIWEQVLGAEPENPRALFHLGQHVLFRGNAARALPMLQRAAELTSNEPAIFLNVSFAYRALGDNAGELVALNQSLAIDPYFFPALLAKGAVLDRAGQKRAAAKTYQDALTIAPPDEQLAAGLKPAIARARTVVAANAAELESFLSERLGQKRAGYKSEELLRFDLCKEVAIGKKKIYTQQPTLLHFPGLPATQYYDREHFPWLPDLEAATSMIREELTALVREDAQDFAPYVQYPPGVPLNQWADLNFSPKWSAFFLWKNDIRNDDHCQRCPRTAQLIEHVPVADIPDFAPTVFFSALQPKTLIPPHTGVTNARLTVHLPLVVPPGCWFRVGNETRKWKEGEAWVFDDTIEHEAYNPSDQLRVILIFDVWNPHLSAAERDLVRELLSSLHAYYSGDYVSR